MPLVVVFMVSKRHIDGNKKLIQPYKIIIHGGLDGFSRMIVFLYASTNNRALTVLQYFQSAVEHYNIYHQEFAVILEWKT